MENVSRMQSPQNQFKLKNETCLYEKTAIAARLYSEVSSSPSRKPGAHNKYARLPKVHRQPLKGRGLSSPGLSALQ